MICTEEEAREKWCPHVRSIGYDDGPVSTNRYTKNTVPEICGCIGSKCMMWVPIDDGRGSCGLSRG